MRTKLGLFAVCSLLVLMVVPNYANVAAEAKELGIAPFVDESKDAQSYVDRYNTEDIYKEWFDNTYPEYDSIYHAVGLEEPLPVPAPFVDESKDAQSYVDRYNTEDIYKEWFDNTYPEYDSIYHAVGLEEPKVGEPEVPEVMESEVMEREVMKPKVGEPEVGECGKGTDLVDGMCMIIDNSGGRGGGGCLIATAAYDSEMAPQVQLLREIRDNQLMKTDSGVSFMSGFNQLYYSFSPYIADMQRENPAFKEMVKFSITPMLSTLYLMQYAESDSEVLSYGIGVIVMNLGMYVGIPAIIVFKTRKYIKI